MRRLVSRSLLPVLTAGLLLAPASLAAQAAVGVGGGLTFATFEGDDADDAGTKTGFMAGAFLSFPLGEIISVAPGAYYVQKGAEFGENGGEQAETKLSYLEIPVLLSVDVTGARRPFGINLFAGPEVAFKLGCDLEAGGQTGDCGDRAKGTDFGLIAGAGLSFGRFFVNGGLDVGLTSIDDTEADDDVKNSMYFVQAGVLFPLGG